MTEYTGNYFTIENSTVFDGQTVNVLEYKRKSSKGTDHSYCFRCGRPLRQHFWTVQTADENLEMCDIGPECVKKLS